jgi:hypothetical protein
MSMARDVTTTCSSVGCTDQIPQSHRSAAVDASSDRDDKEKTRLTKTRRSRAIDIEANLLALVELRTPMTFHCLRDTGHTDYKMTESYIDRGRVEARRIAGHVLARTSAGRAPRARAGPAGARALAGL